MSLGGGIGDHKAGKNKEDADRKSAIVKNRQRRIRPSPRRIDIFGDRRRSVGTEEMENRDGERGTSPKSVKACVAFRSHRLPAPAIPSRIAFRRIKSRVVARDGRSAQVPSPLDFSALFYSLRHSLSAQLDESEHQMGRRKVFVVEIAPGGRSTTKHNKRSLA